jgi:charged multivesicular body protein 6
MKVQRDKLQQYQKKITKLTDRETEIARECLARGQKPKALLALRRKKYQDSLLSKTDQQLEQLQKLTSDVEFAAVQKDVLYGIQQGTAVLKQIHSEMGGIEQVEKLLEENAEARAYQEEISQMLAGQISRADEEEVEDELEAMERDLLPKVSNGDLPNIPTNALPEHRVQEQEEARKAEEPLLA